MTKDLRKFIIFIIMLILLVPLGLSCGSKDTELSPTLPPEILAEYRSIKLIITEDGMYRLPLSDLGWDASASSSFSLTHREQPIPYWIENSETGQSIIFYGQPSTSIYSPQNIYVIQQDSAKSRDMDFQPITGLDVSTVNYFISTIRAEENIIYTPKVENGSPWHWNKIVAPQSKAVEINLPRVANGPGILRVALWGVTTAPVSPAHHVRVMINDQLIDDADWDDQTWHILETSIPAGVLLEGQNTVDIQATGEIDARIDIINLDWIEIDYPKRSDSLEPHEIFRVPEQGVHFTGLEAPLTIFEVNTSSKIVRLEPPPIQKESLVFQGNPDLRYISVTQDGYLYPDQILPALVNPDLRTESGANYIAIGHPELLAPLDPLLEFRAEQSLSTLKIPAEAVYDQFNGGLEEPQAIQNFLRFAVENWSTPPEYVLLVGDASYDFYSYQTPVDKNFIPTYLVNTTFGGETGSDVAVAQINDDQWPDIPIGRVPARTTQQVKTFVAKTLKFEESSSSAYWNKSILAVADGQEPAFKVDAAHFVEQFPETYQSKLISPEPGSDTTNQQIAAEIEVGQLLIAYFGHGSINMWGKDSLFTTEDSGNLDNEDRLPVILNFTCLTGLFTHPTEESLAESLLFNPDGGAVAVLAPTSPTLPNDQSFLSNAFVEAMLQEPVPRLGDITLFSWRKVPTLSQSAVDVMQTFLLFGDPALKMPSP